MLKSARFVRPSPLKSAVSQARPLNPKFAANVGVSQVHRVVERHVAADGNAPGKLKRERRLRRGTGRSSSDVATVYVVAKLPRGAPV